MSPRRPTPDPIELAGDMLEEAHEARNKAWRRSLLHTANARASLVERECALQAYDASPVVEQMRETVEKRRAAIDEMNARLRAMCKNERD